MTAAKLLSSFFNINGNPDDSGLSSPHHVGIITLFLAPFLFFLGFFLIHTLFSGRATVAAVSFFLPFFLYLLRGTRLLPSYTRSVAPL